MASNIVYPSMDCFIMSVPSAFFQSFFEIENKQLKNELVNLPLGSNTLIINEKTSVKLGLNHKLGVSWAALTFNFITNQSDFENLNSSSKRLVQIITDNRVMDRTVIICEDLLMNLNFNKVKKTTNIKFIEYEKPTLKISNEGQNALPSKAVKVVLSFFQSDLENSFVDNLLQKYFAYPRYLCCGDIFSVSITDDLVLGLMNSINCDTVYFKVSELQGPPSTNPDIFKESGYFVDSTVTIYQSSSHQGFLPPRHIPVCYKPSISSLFSDDRIIQKLQSNKQYLVPPSFDDIFNKLFHWMEPFVFSSNKVKDMELNPLFLVSGPTGSGKTLLLQALSQYLGMMYYRLDCVAVGRTIPGQAEGKIKAIFSQLKNLAPCIFHLSNFEALCQDAESKTDIRVVTCFEQQVKLLSCKWPVIIVATTHSTKCISSNINHLFLDQTAMTPPSCEQRKEIILWLTWYNNGTIDDQTLEAVAAQTSGFIFRDLQVLFVLALKEKFKRCKDKKKASGSFVLSDFSRIIGIMHTAYSDSIGAPKVPSVSWKDVGGLEPLKKEILRSLKSNMFSTGLKRSGLLLHGPPGTGKTLLAKAVATQCGRNFLSVKGPELLNMYVGQSEQNVRDLFELAKVAAPCIIFFDELDSLAPNRGRSGDSGGVMDRVVSQLLAEMDDLGSKGDIFILGATNRPDLIDPALLRPGRLDKMLFVGPCEDRNSQLSVLSALTHKLNLDEDVDTQEVVLQLPASVSGAQLSALCSAAWLSSARQLITSGEQNKKTEVVVNKSHFQSALSSVFGQS